jgi:hypothetical protein
MSIWYPKIPIKRLLTVAQLAIFGAVVAGGYGALHDQVSYTISTEYFTQFKFHQFAYADLGWPPRAFVAEIGFLATWWVGLIAGWILGRAGLAELTESAARSHVLRAFAMMLGVAAIAGTAGALLGAAVAYSSDLKTWKEWEQKLALQDLRTFVIVAYLHAGSYVGGLLGLVGALVYVRRKLAQARRAGLNRPDQLLSSPASATRGQ